MIAVMWATPPGHGHPLGVKPKVCNVMVPQPGPLMRMVSVEARSARGDGPPRLYAVVFNTLDQPVKVVVMRQLHGRSRPQLIDPQGKTGARIVGVARRQEREKELLK
jgi:hypothetical protein